MPVVDNKIHKISGEQNSAVNGRTPSTDAHRESQYKKTPVGYLMTEDVQAYAEDIGENLAAQTMQYRLQNRERQDKGCDCHKDPVISSFYLAYIGFRS